MKTAQKDKSKLNSPTRHFFKHEGTWYSLVKRSAARDAKWYFKGMIRGELIVRSMDTNLASNAARKAINEHIDPARNGKPVATSKLRDTYSKLGAVISCYQELCVGKVGPRTVIDNVNVFRMVVRRGLANDGTSNATIDAMSSSVLNGKLISEFEDWMGKQAVIVGRDLESNKRSVASYLRHARSLFKEAFLPRYAEKGVKLADVKEFMERETAKAHKVEKLPPDDTLLKNTLAAVPALREVDRPAYIAWLLGFCSLRRKEISVARWDWVVMVKGKPALRLPAAIQKGGVDKLIPIDPRIVAELAEFKALRCLGLDVEEEKYILPSPRLGQNLREGPRSLRGQAVFNRVNAWMRGLGWDTQHTLHEMRRLAGLLFRAEHGLDKTQTFMRHSDQRTTQDFYVGMEALDGIDITLPLAIGAGK